MADVAGFLKKVLPWIGAAASSAASGTPIPLLTMVAQKLGSITGKKVEPTADSIAAAVAGATPEQLLEMKKEDNDFALQMQEAGFQNEQQLEQIFAGDRASARAMQMQTKSWLPGGLGIFVTLGFFFVLYAMLRWPIPTSGHDALMIMLGSLGTAWTSVVAYYFGSSAGSAKKTDLLAQAPPIPKG